VWRRILVPQTITLFKLHTVIQLAFGWTDTHLHEFTASDGQRYGTSDPDDHAAGEVASERVRLSTALAGARTLRYEYDFGDSWTHRIRVEKVLAPDPQLRLPRCVDGGGARPPEDCGGAPGYEDFLQAMSDLRHPEHASTARWLGHESWDANACEVADINDGLADIRL